MPDEPKCTVDRLRLCFEIGGIAQQRLGHGLESIKILMDQVEYLKTNYPSNTKDIDALLDSSDLMRFEKGNLLEDVEYVTKLFGNYDCGYDKRVIKAIEESFNSVKTDISKRDYNRAWHRLSSIRGSLIQPMSEPDWVRDLPPT